MLSCRNGSMWNAIRETQFSTWDAGSILATLCINMASDYHNLEPASPGGLEESIETFIIFSTGPVVLPDSMVEAMQGFLVDNSRNVRTPLLLATFWMF